MPLDSALDLSVLTARMATAAVAAREALPTADYTRAATFAADVEGLSRCVEYLQLIAARAVEHTRTRAIADAESNRTARRAARVSFWGANGIEILNETDTNWPAATRVPAATPAERTTAAQALLTSPAGDGCRNTAEFLRLRLFIPVREARRRLTLAHQTLPGTTLTGEPIAPTHELLASTLAPADASIGQPATTDTPPHIITAPAVSSHAATIITATLERLQHHTTPETLRGIEHHLTSAATTADPDFLARLAQRLTETIDADGTEPSEEALRHAQGAFIRKPRHGLHRVEIFATPDQYEHLLTAMNIATNPRTTTPNTTTNGDGDVREAGTRGGDGSGNQVAPVPELERRTRPQQQLDGIITAVKTALTTGLLPTTGGNRPQIIATINQRDLFPTPASTTHHTPAAGTFAFTGPIAATTLRKIACDADIIPALLGTNSEILDLGRKTRLFTPAQRLALTARDQGCTFPNCTIPAPWCEAHHITYWSHGGHTNTTNGTLLCTHHHHLIHKENWTINTTGGTPAFIPPPHIDPSQTPQQNHYFKPPLLPPQPQPPTATNAARP
ncbi:HNH endonuclease signature motif containing protein [Pseudarthrobacter chlorophenolicus]|uniref:HNH endonuclease signature motif containing protein n=1 Tax=Pseudarthrobacter chlorophenolicus TaxID=85085 RepID=UPI001F3CF8B4|nr:HNH endonuclease signature motif containing protein [Pseudarthrobacter chlorophenolicus]